MLKTLVRIILLAIIVYFLKDIFETILPIPSESMVEGTFDLTKKLDKAAFDLMRFIVWMVALALIIRFAAPLFSFIAPRAKRYATTKPLRRAQGVLAEVFLFGLIFWFVGSIISIIPAVNTYNDLIAAKEKKIWKDYEEALEFYKKQQSPQRPATIQSSGINRGSAYNNARPLRSSGINRENSYNAQTSRPLNQSSQIYKDNKNPQVNSLRERYKGNQNNSVQPVSGGFTSHEIVEDDINTNKKDVDVTEIDPEIEIPKYAKEEAWEEIGGIFPLYINSFGKAKWAAFFVSLVAFLIIHFANRNWIGGKIEKFLRFLEQGRFGQGGSARFAGMFEEWATLIKNQKEGLFMGRSLYNPFLNIGLEDSRHMLTFAGSRAGKGATAIIPNLLLWKGSTLVVDPKGANAAVTARRRKELGQNVHLIDPFNVLKDKQSASFNPLQYLDPNSSTIREEINVIAEAIVVPDENQKERHWDDGAKTIIAGMIAHLVTSPKYENPNLAMLRDMISALPEEQAELWADMSLNDGAGRLAKDAANRVIRGINTNEISSIISNADKHTEWLSSPAMQKTLGSSSFQFADLKDKPTTVYLILPPIYLQTHNRFLRMFVNLAISQMSVGGRSKVPVLLLMDEFLALGRMDEVEKAFGLMAGYNLIMWPFVQDLGRLKKLYGESVNSFIANSRAVQVFGISDPDTTEFVSDNIGERFISSDLKTMNHRNIVKLRTPAEVPIDISGDANRQYILRSGKAPLVLEKVKYYDSAPLKFMAKKKDVENKNLLGIFHGMYDPDPDYIK